MRSSIFKNYVGLLSFLLASIVASAAVKDTTGIFTQSLKIGGSTVAVASAALELSSTTKGLLISRMTTVQRDAIVAPATGLMIFNTTDSAFNYWDGATWTGVGAFVSPMTTNGDMITQAAGVSARLTIGATGTALTSNGSAPSWNKIADANVAAAAAIAVNKLAALGTTKVAITDGSGFLSTSTVTPTTLAFLDVGSSLTTLLGLKLTDPMTTNGDMITRAAGVPASLAIGATGTTLTSNGSAPSWNKIADANVAAAAAIAVNKLAALGTASIPYTDGSGFLTTSSAAGYDSTNKVISTTGDISGLNMVSVTDTTSSASVKIDHNSTSLLLATAESSTNQGYNLGISTASIAGANANPTGAISLTTGDKTAGTGNSGGITLTAGTTVGGNRGRIVFADGSEGNSPGAVWTVSGNSGAGHWVDPSDSKNYISNPDANIQSTSTTPAGWANYADAAGVLPVDCTGGSPVTALTRNTTTPIGNTTDFRWTKSANNRQGEGFSNAFTIQKTDQAKVMSIGFDYQIASGTFVAGSSGVDSDLEVYIYDVTNAVLIQPSTYKLFSSTTSPPTTFISNFQTASNSTSYRLCVHTATTSASAYTLAFRNFETKRSRYVYGTPITDWTTYTPVITHASGGVTNAVATGLKRRAGDSLEVQGVLTFSSTSAAFSDIYVGLPSGNVIDTAKLLSIVPPNAILGTTAWLDSGVQASATGIAQYISTTAVHIRPAVVATHTGNAAVLQLAYSNTYPITFNTSDTISWKFEVPIAGWSSSLQMSDSAPQADVALQLSGSSTSVTNAVVNIVPTSIVKDTVGGFSGSTYTAKFPGFYQINGTLGGGSVAQTAGQVLALGYTVNGGGLTYLGVTRVQASITTTFYVSGTGFAYLNAGDTVVFRGQADATQTASAFSASIFRIGGPQAIGATEFVGMKYANTAGTSIANSGFINVPFATKVFDTHSAWNGTQYVCPISGRYRFSATLGFPSSVYAVANLVQAALYVNTVATSYGPVTSAATTTAIYMYAPVNTTINCNAGDLLEVRLQNTRTAGATLLDTTAGVNHIEIERIGM